MHKREEKLGLVLEENMNGGIVLLKVQKIEKHCWRGGELGTELCELHSLLPSEKLYNAEGSADSTQSLRTYIHVHRPHMCGHEQHPQTRSGSPHNACISLVNN